jgi:hypothetical protein
LTSRVPQHDGAAAQVGSPAASSSAQLTRAALKLTVVITPWPCS